MLGLRLPDKDPENRQIAVDTAPAQEFNFDDEDMAERARSDGPFEGQLRILCRLAEGECSVTEFESILSARQAAVSQQLARLRQKGIIGVWREGKSFYCFLADERVKLCSKHFKRI